MSRLRRAVYSASLTLGIPRPILRSAYRVFIRNKSTDVCHEISSNYLELDGEPNRTDYRIVVVKSHTNFHGPWRSIGHEDKDALLDRWPGKLLFWHLTSALNVDWYLIDDPVVTTDFMYENAQLGRKVAQSSSGVVSQSDIDFDKYDVVLSIDPILRIPGGKSTLFCYYVTEHTDRYYWISEKKPLTGYDLFLGHMLRNFYRKPLIPQSVPFPFIYATASDMQGKEEAVWVDGRAPLIEADLRSLPLEARTKPCFAPDPPIWDDARRYLQQLVRCRYFLSVGRTGGSGQGVAEAASAGAICLTDLRTPYSHILTHPRCVVNNMSDAAQLISTLHDSNELREAILSWEKERLQRYFFDVPLSILERALETKRESKET